MTAKRDAAELSMQELEALLHLKRRQLTESKVMRLATAESALRQQAGASAEPGQPIMRPARSPESWRGAQGGDRYFRPLAPQPLEAGPDAAQGGARVGRGPRPAWRDVALVVAEAAAFIAFLVVLGALYARLQALNREVRALQQGALGAQAAAKVAATPALGEPATPTAWATLTPTAPLAPTVVAAEARLDATLPGLAPVATLGAGTEPAAAASLTPTITPMPRLPGDRPTPGPTAEGAAEPVAPATATPMATPTPTAVAPPRIDASVAGDRRLARRITIAKIGVDAPVVEGDNWEDLKRGVGHHSESTSPGERGNVVLSAHNDIYGEIFRDLHKLERGDAVLIATGQAEFRYVVERVEIVLPTQVAWMDPTDEPVVTLITCYPRLLDTHRVVVRARQVD